MYSFSLMLKKHYRHAFEATRHAGASVGVRKLGVKVGDRNPRSHIIAPLQVLHTASTCSVRCTALLAMRPNQVLVQSLVLPDFGEPEHARFVHSLLLRVVTVQRLAPPAINADPASVWR